VIDNNDNRLCEYSATEYETYNRLCEYSATEFETYNWLCEFLLNTLQVKTCCAEKQKRLCKVTWHKRVSYCLLAVTLLLMSFY